MHELLLKGWVTVTTVPEWERRARAGYHPAGRQVRVALQEALQGGMTRSKILIAEYIGMCPGSIDFHSNFAHRVFLVLDQCLLEAPRTKGWRLPLRGWGPPRGPEPGLMPPAILPQFGQGSWARRTSLLS